MQDGQNTLVLFEEFGGNPSLVNFQTVTTGTVCANAYEKHTLELECQGRPISSIKFASFGKPQGRCGSFEKGSCDAKNVLSIIQNVSIIFLPQSFFVKFKLHFLLNYGNKYVTSLFQT